MTHPKVFTDPRLRQRYGITPRRRSSFWLSISAMLLAAAWFIWSGIDAANPPVRSNLISFTAEDRKTVSITYTVSVRDLSINHSCSLVARDFAKNVVGEVVDLLPANTLKPGDNQRTVAIFTRVRAVNAGISSCQ
ncbi:MAG: DUF4307 domain-containing protein [Candidatus Nanopelagicus sp.]|nr:DUF4307 domain-containing protein [Candidatus Nanopelagicus sp.]